MRQQKQEQGAALAISLIMLVAMTILGVATLNGSRLAEKVSSNVQQKAIVFEVAESVINLIDSGDSALEAKFDATHTSMYDPPAVPQLTEPNLVEIELDQSNTFGVSVDVNAEAEIQFCGEWPLQGTQMTSDEGGSPGIIGRRYDIRATSTIDNSRARAEHVRRKEMGRMQFDLTGDCATPGT